MLPEAATEFFALTEGRGRHGFRLKRGLELMGRA